MTQRRTLAALTLFALSALIATSALAQRGGFVPHVAGARGFHSGNGRSHSGFYVPWFLPDDTLYDGSLYAPDFASRPNFGVMQPPAPPERLQPVTPLLIELQGDRYVRLSGEENSRTGMLEVATTGPLPAKGRPATSPSPTAHAAVPAQETPAVLIFRDGHREEVSAYTIVDGVLYANGNYYTDGSWNRKVALSSLDLPQTLASNQSRGVRFQLPMSPNEVIVRP